MNTFISILRGINVSGHNKIPMAELKVLYKELGFSGITTYIQSGNVIFRHKSGKDLAKKIEQKIFERFSFKVPVVIRTVHELKQVLADNPFLKEKDNDVAKLHVTFLSTEPQKVNIDAASNFNYEPDKFNIAGREVYVYCPGGYGNTKLTNNFFENKLKVTATTRNWRTINELYKLAEASN